MTHLGTSRREPPPIRRTGERSIAAATAPKRLSANEYADLYCQKHQFERLTEVDISNRAVIRNLSELKQALVVGEFPIQTALEGFSRSIIVPNFAPHAETSTSHQLNSSACTWQEFGDATRTTLSESLLKNACNYLSDNWPHLSASRRLYPAQSFTLIGVFVAFCIGLMIAASQTLYIASVCFTLLFASVICLRSVALLPIRSSTARAEPNLLQGNKLPVYTILVPLFHEANMIKNITDALMAIDYPQELLDIKLILEADDDATVTAAFSQELPDCFEIVLVPPHPLRTKPKALNFALPYARGEFVVIFDAEDRPDPQQLRKAIHEFGLGPPELVCLQASLAYYNTDENWLTRQFAIEYASLFDAFLPAIVQLGLPVPLGGTSNHFKIEALRDAGCWDAYNVTEDADLGVRLARLGYQVGVLGSVTYEEAVPTLGAWIKQRSRWIKGWLQTWLVHTREPLNLLRELGIIKSLAVQIILFGIIVSAIGYPVFLGVALYKLSHGEFVSQSYGWMDRAIGPLQLWVLLFGFIVNMAMGWIAVRRRNLKQLNWQILFIPIYWMLISFASWYAVYQFIFKPFYWEKTNHGGSNHA